MERGELAMTPEQTKAQRAAHYALNRDRIRAAQAVYMAKPEIRERDLSKSIEWYAANKARAKAKVKAYQTRPDIAKKIRVNSRRRSLEKRYGVTPEQVEQMTISQNGACAICFRVARLCVDHNHTTGKIRGMLCNGCNLALGNFRECPLALESAKHYLQKYTIQ